MELHGPQLTDLSKKFDALNEEISHLLRQQQETLSSVTGASSNKKQVLRLAKTTLEWRQDVNALAKHIRYQLEFSRSLRLQEAETLELHGSNQGGGGGTKEGGESDESFRLRSLRSDLRELLAFRLESLDKRQRFKSSPLHQPKTLMGTTTTTSSSSNNNNNNSAASTEAILLEIEEEMKQVKDAVDKSVKKEKAFGTSSGSKQLYENVMELLDARRQLTSKISEELLDQKKAFDFDIGLADAYQSASSQDRTQTEASESLASRDIRLFLQLAESFRDFQLAVADRFVLKDKSKNGATLGFLDSHDALESGAGNINRSPHGHAFPHSPPMGGRSPTNQAALMSTSNAMASSNVTAATATSIGTAATRARQSPSKLSVDTSLANGGATTGTNLINSDLQPHMQVPHSPQSPSFRNGPHGSGSVNSPMNPMGPFNGSVVMGAGTSTTSPGGICSISGIGGAGSGGDEANFSIQKLKRELAEMKALNTRLNMANSQLEDDWNHLKAKYEDERLKHANEKKIVQPKIQKFEEVLQTTLRSYEALKLNVELITNMYKKIGESAAFYQENEDKLIQERDVLAASLSTEIKKIALLNKENERKERLVMIAMGARHEAVQQVKIAQAEQAQMLETFTRDQEKLESIEYEKLQLTQQLDQLRAQHDEAVSASQQRIAQLESEMDSRMATSENVLTQLKASFDKDYMALAQRYEKIKQENADVKAMNAALDARYRKAQEKLTRMAATSAAGAGTL